MKISQDVLVVLSRMEFDGCYAVISDQLDRKLYTKVNDVLVALGGAWNRKMKAHVFPSNAEQRVDEVLISGEVETARDVGFFETPELLAAQLVKMADVKRGDHVLEPSAGNGRIVAALQEVGARVTVIERDRARRAHLLASVLKSKDALGDVDDFMEYRPKNKFDRVVMNPPFCKVGFGDHIEHVRYAYPMLKPGGVLVSILPAGVAFREDSRHSQFRKWLLDSGIITELPEGSFSSSGTQVRTVVARIVR